MHNKVMNYHVQYLLTLRSVFVELRHFERDTQAAKSGGIFYPPSPLRRRDTQQVLSHPAAHCFGHNLFPLLNYAIQLVA